MKNLYILVLIALNLCVTLSGCSKSSSKSTNTGTTPTHPAKPDSTGMVSVSAIEARWSIVSDTVANTNNYYYMSGGDAFYPPSGNYIGGTNDYLTFNTNGSTSGSEDGVSAMGSYQLLVDSGISMSLRPDLMNARVVTLTTNALTITGRATGANGSMLVETIYLTK